MPGSQDGKIRLDAAKLIKEYPTHRAESMPPSMKEHFRKQNEHIDKENKKKEEWNKAHPTEKPKKPDPHATSCVFQVSWALNAVGGDHTIPPRSHWRPNTPLAGGGYHMGGVNELEVYLGSKYGDPEILKSPTVNAGATQAAMEKRIAGRQGIIAFREGWGGAHTEIWDKTRVLQNGAPIANNSGGTAVMDQKWMWGRPTILFWEILAPKPTFVAPAWLVGWWHIADFPNNYYYYFYPDGTVVYTKTAPTMAYCPVPSSDKSGSYTLPGANAVRIKWNDEDYNAEVFGYVGFKDVSAMAGTYEGIAALPFAALKMSFRRP